MCNGCIKQISALIEAALDQARDKARQSESVKNDVSRAFVEGEVSGTRNTLQAFCSLIEEEPRMTQEELEIMLATLAAAQGKEIK